MKKMVEGGISILNYINLQILYEMTGWWVNVAYSMCSTWLSLLSADSNVFTASIVASVVETNLEHLRT